MEKNNTVAVKTNPCYSHFTPASARPAKSGTGF